jgi:serine phosphatase RsbU (regulator of sigma subunit)
MKLKLYPKVFLIHFCLVLLTACLGLNSYGHTENVYSESAVTRFNANEEAKYKAKLIYAFITLIDWPKQKWESIGKNFEIYIVGNYIPETELYNELAENYQDKSVGATSLKFFQVCSLYDVPPNACIVYFSARSGLDIQKVDAHVPSDCLTIGESTGFNEAMINIIVDGQSIKFNINKTKLLAQKFRIATKLEYLSKEVLIDSASSIATEVEWNSLLDKFSYSINSNEASNIYVNKSELAALLEEYMDRQKALAELIIEYSAIDSALLTSKKQLEQNQREFERKKIALDNKLLEIVRLDEKLNDQENLLNENVNRQKFLTEDIETKENQIKTKELQINEQITALEELNQNIESKNVTIDKNNSTIGAQRNFIVFAILGIVFLLLLAGFVYRSYTQKKKSNEIILAQKIVVEQQKELVEKQKEQVEEAHKEITDSINYAERLQRSLMADEKLLAQNLGNYFVYFNPKEAVSGDFYWSAELPEKKFVLVCADSTGHGVPGAIMSMMNMNSLKEAVKEGQTKSDEILNHTRKTIIQTLANDGSAEGGKDGMDAVLLIFNHNKTELEFSLANNPLWIIRAGELLEFKADKMPVGRHDKQDTLFTRHTEKLQKGDLIYIFTDGFADQFGGEKGKKFKYSALKELLLSIAEKPMEEQKTILSKTFENWRGNLEQVDDVCVVGVRV